MNRSIIFRSIATGILAFFTLLAEAQPSIDRHALVLRHTVVNEKPDPLSALSLGNGGFAWTVDVTGLQTFPEYYEKGIPLGTQSEWGWHSFSDTSHFAFEESLKEYDFNGHKATYAVQWNKPERNKKAADWFRQNVHRLQLGNIGLEMTKKDGSPASLQDLTHIHQELNMWAGEISSHFLLEGVAVDVSSFVHPRQDLVSISIHSALLEQGRLRLRLRFPYPTGAFADAGDNWQQAGLHRSVILRNNNTGALLEHVLDTTHYFVTLKWSGGGNIRQKQPHYFLLSPSRDSAFSFSCRFSPQQGPAGQSSSDPHPATHPAPGHHSVNGSIPILPSYKETKMANARAWPAFWSEGGAVDFTGSTDPRAAELERRIVLSQWLTRIQCAGNYPPQETGLTYNSWYGKPHLEMHWWHAAHFALWGRPELLERSLGWYAKVAGMARRIAERQGYKGVRWQKMTDPDGRESPSSVGAFLIWQEPHFIYFSELCWRQHKDRGTLEKYRKLVFATADFMASYARYDSPTHRYILGKGIIPAQERFGAEETFNPCFELAYWRWALATAQQWRIRLGLPRKEEWDKVLNGLSPLPQQGGIYLPAESATDAYTNERYRGDHPVVLAAYGFLPRPSDTSGSMPSSDTSFGSLFRRDHPGDLDPDIMRFTFDWVWKNWKWEETWGWDFPLTAMTATRLGLPDRAIDALLMPVKKNTYLSNGHNYQDERLRLYLPGNGGLLSAIAIMCAGYDGCDQPDPGIPKNGKWKVKWEGLSRMP
ncbi:MAG TPA: hypothetical protein VK563_08910 [Puia sp.]|nr:hypothetical protein [Puia sp.]